VADATGLNLDVQVSSTGFGNFALESAPGLGIWAAFIGAIATLVVAIRPPTNFQSLLKSTYRYYRFTLCSL
jgi:hypothetical protein